MLLGTDTERDGATRMAIARMSIGGTLMFPGLARRLFGIPENQDSGSLRMLARLFGVRNIVLGAWALMAREQGPEERLLCYRLNAVVDAADVFALAWGGATGEGLVQAAVMGSGLGLSAAVAWIELAKDVASAASDRSVALA